MPKPLILGNQTLRHINGLECSVETVREDGTASTKVVWGLEGILPAIDFEKLDELDFASIANWINQAGGASV